MIRLSVLLFSLLASMPAFATEAGWALLREGGQVVLLRHAYAQGGPDWPGLDLADCQGQRALSERGRQQARKIGSLLDARAAPTEHVQSSRLCRALATAELAFRGKAEPSEVLDPVAAGDQASAERKRAIVELVGAYKGSGNLILVTDLSVIQAATGAGAREGEAVIVRRQDDGLHVAARVVFN